jgi:hypothetical protein
MGKSLVATTVRQMQAKWREATPTKTSAPLSLITAVALPQ